MTVKKATISDIVRLTGVSKTTVSRFLNGRYEFMSEETRQRIEQAVAELNYHPSAAAQSLRSRHTHMVGIILSGFGGQDFTQELSAICAELDKKGYTPIIFQGSDDPVKEREALTRCISQNVDGIILHPASGDHAFYEQVMLENDTPVLLVGRNIPDWKYDRVYIDQPAVVRRAMDRFREQGFRNAALFSPHGSSPMSNIHVRRNAWAGYQKEHGVSPESLLFEVRRNSAGVYTDLEKQLEAFLALARRERTACIVSGTDLLIQLLSLIRRKGLRIPEDFGLCGFNAWNWLELVNPDILIINRPLSRLGEESGRLKLERLEKGTLSDPKTVILEASFSDEQPDGREN